MKTVQKTLSSEAGSGIDPVLVELSGSTENYQQDMALFLQHAKTTIEKMRATKTGRQKLKKAGLA